MNNVYVVSSNRKWTSVKRFESAKLSKHPTVRSCRVEDKEQGKKKKDEKTD